MKSTIRFFVFLLLISLTISCDYGVFVEYHKGFGKPETETTDEYEVTYQYKDGVIVIDETASTFVEMVDETTILVSMDIPEKYLPAENDIVSCVVYDGIPYGLGHRVTEVETDGNVYKCTIEAVPLDEIFEELEIKASFSLLDSVTDGFYDDDGVFWETSISSDDTRASFDLPDLLTINLGNKANESSKLFATGSLTVGLKGTINMSLSQQTYECYLDVTSGFGGELGCKGWQGKKKLFSKKGLVKGAVTIGPVVFRPYANLAFGLQADVEGSVSSDFDKKFVVRTGVKDGRAFYENATSGDGDFIKSLSIDMKGSVGVYCEVDYGIGVYVENVALGIEPVVSFGLDTDFQLSNPNLLRNQSQLGFNLNADVDVFFLAYLFGKELAHAQESLVSLNLLSYSWPLFPTLLDNTLEVEKRDSDDQLIFDSKYELSGGLLCKFYDIYPSFRVYRGANEVLSVVDDQPVTAVGSNTCRFELKNLEQDIAYTGKPCISFLGNIYDEDGIPFSSTSPTAAITDIVQTGSAQGSFMHEGNEYEYEFYFYTNAEIIGSDSCTEWGIYDPDSVNEYNPLELKDGRVTEYWTGWSNSPSVAFSETPYVILKETGDYKFFETHSIQLYHGTAVKSIIPCGDDFVVQLDSVKFCNLK